MSVWTQWGMEIFTLMAGYISITALAAQSILRAISNFFLMIPMGVRIASNITIGKNVGAELPQECRLFYKAAVALVLIYALTMMTALNFFKSAFQNLFTNDSNVIAELNTTWTLFTVFCLFDQLNCISQAAIMIAGRQVQGSLITVVGYFGIGMSIICYEVFKNDSGLAGIWYGATAAVVFNTAAFLASEYTTNWEKVAQEASKRRAAEKTRIKEAESEQTNTI